MIEQRKEKSCTLFFSCVLLSREQDWVWRTPAFRHSHSLVSCLLLQQFTYTGTYKAQPQPQEHRRYNSDKVIDVLPRTTLLLSHPGAESLLTQNPEPRTPKKILNYLAVIVVVVVASSSVVSSFPIVSSSSSTNPTRKFIPRACWLAGWLHLPCEAVYS